ncbi:MAG: hypothetical protein COT74_04390 [Bdellovibrionales bacterium CG10_big_fil_rev_8_21_14_0_10_45_34]|nr:MAG: hypothetical protein COT74_04390 [Bdellovibrionales bacterium CG10_big_fil_rev_8_21_14_0_10_45_34]
MRFTLFFLFSGLLVVLSNQGCSQNQTATNTPTTQFELLPPAEFEFEPSVSSADETLIFDGKSLTGGWTTATDPDVFKIGDTWFMLFTSIKDWPIKLYIVLAKLPSGNTLDSTADKWTILTEVLSPSIDSNAWDARAVETPKYVKGYDHSQGKWVDRIYYTGWREDSAIRNYQIGYAEYDGSIYVKHPTPVLSAAKSWEYFNGKSFLGDQTVYFDVSDSSSGPEGTWHMFYQVTSSELADTVLVHATSADGTIWPEANRSIVSAVSSFHSSKPSPGPFHVDVFRHANKNYLVGWSPATSKLSKQGIWALRFTQNGNGSVTSDNFWTFLLGENNGTSWHDSGLETSLTHETGLFGSTLVEENGKLWLFYHGVSKRNGENVGSIGKALLQQL